MAFQLSPGVVVTERDLTTIVPTVAVTNAGMAGLFEWGPAEKITVVGSVQELIAEFGLPRSENYQWWFTAANYLGYGNNLRIVRTVHADAKNASPSSSKTLLNDPDDADLLDSGSYGEWIARYPGTLGNSLRIELCGGATATAGADTLTDGARYYGWKYKGEFGGIPSTSLYASSKGIVGQDEFHMVIIDEEGKFSGATGTVLEKYEGLSVIPGAVSPDGSSMYYKTKLNSSSKYIAALDADAPTVTTFTQGLLTSNGSVNDTSAAYNWNFNISAGTYVSGGVLSGSFGGGTGNYGSVENMTSPTSVLGYNKFSDPDTVDMNLLLCGPLSGTDAANVANIAKARMDCVAFVSTPNYTPTNSPADKLLACTTVRDAVGNNNYAFIDSGWKMMYDPYNDTNRWVPLNGDIAGLCARTDVTNDPWWSPAGFNRGQIRNVIKLAFNPTKTQRDEIYPKGINPVVTFPGEGTVLYGDKTAQTKPSAFDRINVRRLFIVLEKSIAVAAKYSLFEFNDSFTRAQFKSMVEPFLRDVQARRGIVDFKVVCSEANNTSQVVDSNRFVADIYIKPNRSINYIQLNFIATKSGVSFEEVGA